MQDRNMNEINIIWLLQIKSIQSDIYNYYVKITIKFP